MKMNLRGFIKELEAVGITPYNVACDYGMFYYYYFHWTKETEAKIMEIYDKYYSNFVKCILVRYLDDDRIMISEAILT